MIELQVLCYILSTKDFSIVRLNALDVTYFPNYKKEFTFICNHYDEYGVVCDKETFINMFPEFKFIDVHETPNYLLDKLNEEFTFNKTLPIIQKAANILSTGDSRQAVQFAVNELSLLDTSKSVPVVDLINDAKIRYDKYLEKTTGQKSYYISTGFKELDQIMGGWDCEEEFGVVCARTNQGKSWWLVYFLLQAAKEGKTVGLYSGEMSEDKVGYRLDTFLSHISNFKISKGYSEIKDEYKAHIDNITNIKGKFLVITPKTLGGPATVPKLRSFVEKYKIDVLGIDQYSLMADVSGTKVRFERYENISMNLKLLQTQLKIPVLIAAQLGRSATSQDKLEVGTEDLAGSDRIAQDATTIITIKQKEQNVVCQIIKGRECKVGDKLTYQWDIDKGRFIYIPTEHDALGNEETFSAIKQKFEENTQEGNIF